MERFPSKYNLQYNWPIGLRTVSNLSPNSVKASVKIRRHAPNDFQRTKQDSSFQAKEENSGKIGVGFHPSNIFRKTRSQPNLDKTVRIKFQVIIKVLSSSYHFHFIPSKCKESWSRTWRRVITNRDRDLFQYPYEQSDILFVKKHKHP
jgi:hypothetical protein